MPKQSHSKYKGGFITVNGRANNSVAYNHDYYESNKDKWKNLYNQKKKKKYGKIADWLGFDERDEYKKAQKELKDAIRKIEEDKPEDFSDRNLTPLKQILECDFEEIYERLNDEERRAFWRSIIKEIIVDGKDLVSVVFY